MVKKRRPVRRKKRLRRSDAARMESLLEKAQSLLLAHRYEETIDVCNAVLDIAPSRSKQRVEALTFKASALALLNYIEAAYDVFSLAQKIDPNDPYLWFQRGMAAFHIGRPGEAVLHLRRAVELEGNGEFADKYSATLAEVEDFAHREQAKRGPDFTLEQLIEQEVLFRLAVELLEAGEWKEAENYFRQAIEMGDCLPHPWVNLGISLLMQHRYDEAEDAFNRALEIDPDYEEARENLRGLADIRATGEPPIITISSPYQDPDTEIDATFEDE